MRQRRGEEVHGTWMLYNLTMIGRQYSESIGVGQPVRRLHDQRTVVNRTSDSPGSGRYKDSLPRVFRTVQSISRTATYSTVKIAEVYCYVLGFEIAYTE